MPFAGSCSAPAVCIHASPQAAGNDTWFVALACLTGKVHAWQVYLHSSPAGQQHHVTPLWSLQVSQRPIFAAPVAFRAAITVYIAAVAVDGARILITAHDGHVVWRHNVHLEANPASVFATPTILGNDSDSTQHASVDLLVPLQPRHVSWVSGTDGSVVQHLLRLPGDHLAGVLATQLCLVPGRQSTWCIGCSSGGVVFVMDTTDRVCGAVVDAVGLPGESFSGMCVLQHQKQILAVTGCRDEHVYCFVLGQ